MLFNAYAVFYVGTTRFTFWRGSKASPVMWMGRLGSASTAKQSQAKGHGNQRALHSLWRLLAGPKIGPAKSREPKLGCCSGT